MMVLMVSSMGRWGQSMGAAHSNILFEFPTMVSGFVVSGPLPEQANVGAIVADFQPGRNPFVANRARDLRAGISGGRWFGRRLGARRTEDGLRRDATATTPCGKMPQPRRPAARRHSQGQTAGGGSGGLRPPLAKGKSHAPPQGHRRTQSAAIVWKGRRWRVGSCTFWRCPAR